MLHWLILKERQRNGVWVLLREVAGVEGWGSGTISSSLGDCLSIINRLLTLEPKSLIQKGSRYSGAPTTWLLGVTAFKLFVFSQSSVSRDKAWQKIGWFSDPQRPGSRPRSGCSVDPYQAVCRNSIGCQLFQLLVALVEQSCVPSCTCGTALNVQTTSTTSALSYLVINKCMQNHVISQISDSCICFTTSWSFFFWLIVRLSLQPPSPSFVNDPWPSLMSPWDGHSSILPHRTKCIGAKLARFFCRNCWWLVQRPKSATCKN